MVLIGVGGNQKVPWFDYLRQEVGKFKDDLNRIVDKYAFYLDPIRLIQQSSWLIHHLSTLSPMDQRS